MPQPRDSQGRYRRRVIGTGPAGRTLRITGPIEGEEISGVRSGKPLVLGRNDEPVVEPVAEKPVETTSPKRRS